MDGWRGVAEKHGGMERPGCEIQVTMMIAGNLSEGRARYCLNVETFLGTLSEQRRVWFGNL